jgi:hypothetical protein
MDDNTDQAFLAVNEYNTLSQNKENTSDVAGTIWKIIWTAV